MVGGFCSGSHEGSLSSSFMSKKLLFSVRFCRKRSRSAMDKFSLKVLTCGYAVEGAMLLNDFRFTRSDGGRSRKRSC